MILLLALACSDYSFKAPPVTPPADPPGTDPDAAFGDPPDWTSCSTGYLAQFRNLGIDDPDVEPDELDPVEEDPEAVDWFDGPAAYTDFEPSLDLGSGWWPLDEGLEGDPAYFTARFTAWIRVWSGGTATLAVGAADDLWVLVNDQVVVSEPGVHEFVPHNVDISLSAGQFPLDIRYAHRAGDTNGLRFRVVSGNVTVCYPDFSANQEEEGAAEQ